MTSMNIAVGEQIWTWIKTAVGGTPKVYFDYPNDKVTSLPRYVIIGANNDAESQRFIGTRIDATQTGSVHELDYDIECWSKSSKQVTEKIDLIEEYILKNIGSFGANQIINVEVLGQNHIFLDEQRIHRKILTIKVSYVKQR